VITDRQARVEAAYISIVERFADDWGVPLTAIHMAQSEINPDSMFGLALSVEYARVKSQLYGSYA
jgi:hypothetical protein